MTGEEAEISAGWRQSATTLFDVAQAQAGDAGCQRDQQSADDRST